MDKACPHYDKTKYDPDFVPKKRGNFTIDEQFVQSLIIANPESDTPPSAGSAIGSNVDEEEATAILNAIYARLQVFDNPWPESHLVDFQNSEYDLNIPSTIIIYDSI